MINYGASIQLADKMTPILNNIISALDMTISTVYDMQSSVDSFDASGLDTIRETIAQAEAGMQDVREEINRNTDAQGKFNNSIEDGVSASGDLKDAISSVASAFGLYKIADVLEESTQELVSLSDEMSGYEARLMLNVDEGSIDEVKAKIYNAAQDSRADYTDMMASVSKLGILAGDSFSDSLGNVNYDQIIDFQNLMNKNFAIGGASATEQASAMYQLTQAMASGKLQGDEFRSITENAPLLNQAIEDYMNNIVGVDGTMKEWAADGLLTADVIKNAVFSSADDINAKFETIPMTWAQVGTQLKNEASVMLDPLLDKINELANNEDFVNMMSSIISGLTTVVSIASWVIDLMVNGALFIYDHWNIIGPIFYGVAAILAVLAAAWVFLKLQSLRAAAAQMLANSTMLTAIVIIIAVVAAIFLVANAIVEMTGCANSGFSAIVGGIYVVGAWFENLWYLICNIGNGISTLFDAVTYNFRLAFHNAIAHVQSWFYGLLSTATTVIAGICELLNKLPFVEFDYSGIVSKASEYAEKSAAAENSLSTSEYKDLSDAFNAGFNTYDTFEEGWAAEAFANGTAKGDNISEKLNSLFSAETIPEIDLGGGETDYSGYLSSIEDSAGSTAGDTSDIKDTVSASSDDELEWIRKIAERETVNRFTTAEIKLDFQSNATINSDIDIDGFINTFTEELGEVLVTTAEGLEE